MSFLRSFGPFGAIVGLGFAIFAGGYSVAQYQVDAAWQSEIIRARGDVSLHAEQVRFKLDLIGTNLRTMSLLSGVRGVTRDNKILDVNGKGAIQQIYNNLASQIDVSEVYITPESFNPTRLDADTQKFEEPALMFDELIVDAGRFAKESQPEEAVKLSGESQPELPEVESFEYGELVRQIDVMRTRWGTFDKNNMRNLPVHASEEVITCDNTVFAKTGNDDDRKGIIFSTPYYSQSGQLGGIVSAIIRSKALRAMLPNQSYTLDAPTLEVGAANQKAKEVELSNWSPSLFDTSSDAMFDVAAAIYTSDPQGPWNIETHLSAASFYAGKDYNLIRNTFFGASAALVLIVSMGLAWVAWARQKSHQIRHNATHDTLTNLPNRRFIEDRYKEAVAQAAHGKIVTVLYLDLDRFKIINDAMGHLVGDIVIKEAAQRIRAAIRKNDFVGRMGGDEFVVLAFDDGVAADSVAAMAERIINDVQKPMMINGRTVDIGTSVGIATLEAGAVTTEDAIKRADLALFRAKTDGRSQYRFFDESMDRERVRRQVISTEIKSALVKQQFELHYQLIVDAITAEPTGCEALLRWRHPELGMVSPAEFIPVAEETGIIHKIGEWVLNRACADAAKLPKKYQMAVNVSPMQLQSPTFGLHVTNAVAQSGIKASRLELEFTESVFLAATNDVKAMITELRTFGVSIALDDFGVGYSSLSYLKDFQFDRIKLDRSFMRNIDGKRDMAVLKAATSLGASLGVAITAEGVETQEQLAVVRAQGCTEVQGFLFSRPAPIDALDFRKAETGKKRA